MVFFTKAFKEVELFSQYGKKHEESFIKSSDAMSGTNGISAPLQSLWLTFNDTASGVLPEIAVS